MKEIQLELPLKDPDDGTEIAPVDIAVLLRQPWWKLAGVERILRIPRSTRPGPKTIEDLNDWKPKDYVAPPPLVSIREPRLPGCEPVRWY